MANRTLRTSGHRGITDKVFKHLLKGEKISSVDAYELWREMNVRNKISILRGDGWPIRSEEKPSGKGGVYKIYYLDMDESLWPLEKGETA